jgi:hypothetical protein
MKMERPTHKTLCKIPLVLDPQPEGGYAITCPLLPELITEGDKAEEALRNVPDALGALRIFADCHGFPPLCERDGQISVARKDTSRTTSQPGWKSPSVMA